MPLKLKSLLLLAFYAALLSLFFLFESPRLPKPQKELLLSTLSGSNQGFRVLGHEFELYRPHLPPEGPVSFLMDFPFSPYSATIDQLYTAQAYLCPVVLNPNPGELGAIFHTSSAEVALRRSNETGYRLILPLGEGRAIGARQT